MWEAKVADTDHGYAIEFRIPLSALRFSALPVQDWGFQVRRFIDARQETDDWAFYPRTRRHLRAAVRPARQPGRAAIPATRSSCARSCSGASATAPPTPTRRWHEGWSTRPARSGSTRRLHVTNELTLDVTLNPDFGQVEADAVVLNLSTFETFFPEKRPFFLEGIDTFADIRPLVYTRRIGRPAAALAALGPSETLVDEPRPVADLRRGEAGRDDRRAHQRWA